VSGAPEKDLMRALFSRRLSLTGPSPETAWAWYPALAHRAVIQNAMPTVRLVGD
jgi:hypothetical protein